MNYLKLLRKKDYGIMRQRYFFSYRFAKLLTQINNHRACSVTRFFFTRSQFKNEFRFLVYLTFSINHLLLFIRLGWPDFSRKWCHFYKVTRVRIQEKPILHNFHMAGAQMIFFDLNLSSRLFVYFCDVIATLQWRTEYECLIVSNPPLTRNNIQLKNFTEIRRVPIFFRALNHFQNFL